MLEITRKNCYKCDLEIITLNNSQYFWINLKDLEVETESNWQNIFSKYENSSALKYRKELTPNIHFQPDRIFIRNDLFKKIIKSCKATNVEFLMLKEKLGLCPYGVICDKQKFILPEIQDDIEELKKENEEPIKRKRSDESTKEPIKWKIKSSDETTEEPIEIKSSDESIKIKSPKKDENTTDWYDKNKFKKILAIANSNKFNHKNKIGKLKYNDIGNLNNNIKNNKISEILAKENLKVLNEIKKAEIKNKRLISGQKELLEFFNKLRDIILTEDNNNNSSSNSKSDNNNNNNNNNNEDENKDENENENEDVNEEENKDDDDDDKDKNEEYYIIKQINGYFKTIETKSFEE